MRMYKLICGNSNGHEAGDSAGKKLLGFVQWLFLNGVKLKEACRELEAVGIDGTHAELSRANMGNASLTIEAEIRIMELMSADSVDELLHAAHDPEMAEKIRIHRERASQSAK